jgi:uncharacterized membrane protein
VPRWLLFGAAGAFAACTQITELGTLGGTSAATAVNDQGLVIGSSAESNSFTNEAVKFLANGVVERLPLPPGAASCTASAIASDGSISGSCIFFNGNIPFESRAVLWDPAGVIRDIGVLGPNHRTTANDINNHGVVVGSADQSRPAEGYFEPWVYDPSVGRITPLPTPMAASRVQAVGINDAGDIIGAGYITRLSGESSDFMPMIWRGPERTVSVLRVPSSCRAAGGNRVNASATAINNHGVIVGSCDAGALIWRTPSSVGELLPAPARLPNDASVRAWASALNDEGKIVGAATHSQGDTSTLRGVGWHADGRLVDFGDAIPAAINNAGLTVGRRGERAVQMTW